MSVAAMMMITLLIFSLAMPPTSSLLVQMWLSMAGIEDNAITDDVLSSTQTRASNNSENEILILACVWIKNSANLATGKDQKSVTFWKQIGITYGHFVATTNNKHSKTHEPWIQCATGRPSTKSLKSQWHNDLLPIVSKFAGIVETTPPPNSGEQYNDDDLTSYYGRLWNKVYLLVGNASNMSADMSSCCSPLSCFG